MFSTLHPVDHYLKEIKVTPRRWRESKPYVPPSSLPFVNESAVNIRQISPILRNTPRLHSPGCGSNADPEKTKQTLHREITFYFGRDKQFPNHDIPRDSRKEKSVYGLAWQCNDEAMRQLYQYSRYTPRQRTLMKQAMLQRSNTYV